MSKPVYKNNKLLNFVMDSNVRSCLERSNMPTLVQYFVACEYHDKSYVTAQRLISVYDQDGDQVGCRHEHIVARICNVGTETITLLDKDENGNEISVEVNWRELLIPTTFFIKKCLCLTA